MGFLSKIKARAKDPRPISDSDLDRSSPTPLRSNSIISRPPPLDPQTERELRNACAIVLADLKPSGHDLEDTRMKSDFFVGRDEAFDVRNQQSAQQKPGPAPAVDKTAPWTLHKDPRLSHKNMPRTEPGISSTRQAQAAMGIDLAGANPLNARTKPVAVPGRTSSQAAAAEGPLAPPQSTSSSAYPQVASPQLQPAQRDNSVSTAASSAYPLSSEHSKSASTALSSAPFTPSDTSHRLSDNVYSQHASAKDSQWMKETAEKQRQAYVANEPASSSQNAIRPAPAAASKSVVTELQERPSSTGSRSRSLHSHPVTDGVAQAPVVLRSPSRQSFGSQKQSIPQSPSLNGRSGSVQSRRSSRPASGRLSIDGIRETDRSPAASPTREAVPPVPPLDARRVTSFQAARPLSQVSVATSSRGEPSDYRPVKQPEPALSTRPGAAPSNGAHQGQPANWPITESFAKQQVQSSSVQPVRLPAKHNQDDSVVVKDFYQPASGPQADGFQPLNREPRPEDFEHLMSTMNRRANLLDGVSPDSPTVPVDTIRGLRISDPPAGEQQHTMSLNTRTTQPVGTPSTQLAANEQIAHHSPTLSVSRNDGARSPSIPPSRASSRSIQAALSMNSRKEKRGVRGLLWKLSGGGGDAPSRRQVYVPPAMMGYGGYDDYWEDADDQACAAPVVGFGRGW